MLDFTANKKCRSQFLLEYFGETETKPCGKCNVCLNIDDTILENNSYLTIKKMVIAMFNENDELSIDIVITKLSEFEREEILYALRWMGEHDLVNINENLNTIRLLS